MRRHGSRSRVAGVYSLKVQTHTTGNIQQTASLSPRSSVQHGVPLTPRTPRSLRALISEGRTVTLYHDNRPPTTALLFYVSAEDDDRTITEDEKEAAPPLGSFYWTEPGTRTASPQQCIPIRNIRDVYIGKQTEVFDNIDDNEMSADYCFSIITKDNINNIHVATETTSIRNAFISAIRELYNYSVRNIPYVERVRVVKAVTPPPITVSDVHSMTMTPIINSLSSKDTITEETADEIDPPTRSPTSSPPSLATTITTLAHGQTDDSTSSYTFTQWLDTSHTKLNMSYHPSNGPLGSLTYYTNLQDNNKSLIGVSRITDIFVGKQGFPTSCSTSIEENVCLTLCSLKDNITLHLSCADTISREQFIDDIRDIFVAHRKRVNTRNDPQPTDTKNDDSRVVSPQLNITSISSTAATSQTTTSAITEITAESTPTPFTPVDNITVPAAPLPQPEQPLSLIASSPKTEILRHGRLFQYVVLDEQVQSVFMWFEPSDGKQGTLYWTPADDQDERVKSPSACVALHRVTTVNIGQTSSALMSIASTLISSKQCFTLVTKQSSFSFIAETEDLRKDWLAAIKSVYVLAGKQVDTTNPAEAKLLAELTVVSRTLFPELPERDSIPLRPYKSHPNLVTLSPLTPLTPVSVLTDAADFVSFTKQSDGSITSQPITIWYDSTIGRLGTLYVCPLGTIAQCRLQPTTALSFLPLHTLTDIYTGKKSYELRQTKLTANRCFSLISKNIQLHLSAISAFSRQCWMDAIQMIFSRNGRTVKDDVGKAILTKVQQEKKTNNNNDIIHSSDIDFIKSCNKLIEGINVEMNGGRPIFIYISLIEWVLYWCSVGERIHHNTQRISLNDITAIRCTYSHTKVIYIEYEGNDEPMSWYFTSSRECQTFIDAVHYILGTHRNVQSLTANTLTFTIPSTSASVTSSSSLSKLVDKPHQLISTMFGEAQAVLDDRKDGFISLQLNYGLLYTYYTSIERIIHVYTSLGHGRIYLSVLLTTLPSEVAVHLDGLALPVMFDSNTIDILPIIFIKDNIYEKSLLSLSTTIIQELNDNNHIQSIDMNHSLQTSPIASPWATQQSLIEGIFTMTSLHPTAQRLFIWHETSASSKYGALHYKPVDDLENNNKDDNNTISVTDNNNNNNNNNNNENILAIKRIRHFYEGCQHPFFHDVQYDDKLCCSILTSTIQLHLLADSVAVRDGFLTMLRRVMAVKPVSAEDDDVIADLTPRISTVTDLPFVPTLASSLTVTTPTAADYHKMTVIMQTPNGTSSRPFESRLAWNDCEESKEALATTAVDTIIQSVQRFPS